MVSASVLYKAQAANSVARFWRYIAAGQQGVPLLVPERERLHLWSFSLVRTAVIFERYPRALNDLSHLQVAYLGWLTPRLLAPTFPTLAPVDGSVILVYGGSRRLSPGKALCREAKTSAIPFGVHTGC